VVPKNLTDEQDTLGSLLRRCFEGLVATVYACLAAEGFADLRPAHGAVFRHILPAGMRTTDLAQAAGMAKQSMAYLVGDLETLGYVEILPDPTDGRAKVVRLTGRGREAQTAAARISQEIEGDWGRKVGEPEWKRLRSILADLATSLQTDTHPM
jgi:DNA-binding MarR family transcriptional regulator